MTLVRTWLTGLPGIGRVASLAYARPLHTPRVVLGAAAVGVTAALLGTATGRRLGRECWRLGLADRRGERLPEKENRKPTVFIDLEEVLLKKTFSFASLGYVFTVREHTGAFLFHLSNQYEVVTVSSLPPELGAELLLKVDPYGCVKYRMFVQNQAGVELGETNRRLEETVWVKSTPHRSPNALNIGEWGGETEDGLLLVLDFLVHLPEMERTDFRQVLASYRGQRFAPSYQAVQAELYPGKRRWLLFQDSAAKDKSVAAVNRQRVEEYAAAKEYIDNQLRLSAHLPKQLQ